MPAGIFSHLGEVASAFTTPRLVADPKLAKAWETLTTADGGQDALGFTKRKPLDTREPQRLKAAKKRLSEQGQNLTDDEIALLQARVEATQIRSRFWVQASLSFLIVGVCLAMLWRGQVDEHMQKALFALLGTVVGFWLR